MIQFDKKTEKISYEKVVVDPGTYFAKIETDDQWKYYKFVIPENKGYSTTIVIDDNYVKSIMHYPCEQITGYNFERIFSKDRNTYFIEEAEFMAHLINVQATLQNLNGNEEKK